MNSISAWSVLSLASFILTGCSGSSVAITPTPPPPPASVVDTAFASQATVGRLYLDGEAQLAGTSEGLFWRANAQADWQQRSPTTAHVNAVAVIAPGHYIVAMKPASTAPHTQNRHHCMLPRTAVRTGNPSVIILAATTTPPSTI